MAELAYADLTFTRSGLEHDYGSGVHLCRDAYLQTLLARLCAKETVQPQVNWLVGELYRSLTQLVLAAEFPRRRVEVPTRMVQTTPRGVYVGEVIEPQTRAVVVDIARAGMLPSAVVYDQLNYVLKPGGVRQDHVVASRTTDETTGSVTGVAMSKSKVAGDAAGAMLLLPDPMGATGSSMVATVDLYTQAGMEQPAKLILMHLIVTPQYLKRVLSRFPTAKVYAVRLDRGMSDPDLLTTRLGSRWDEEDGLDDHQYIVPGGGGFGEILNNAYV